MVDELEQGWHRDASQLPSPNFDDREAGAEPEVIIVHCISLPPGQYGGNEVERFFTNKLDYDAHPYYEKLIGVEVSAHFYIRREGELKQFVATDKRAWHAGESVCLGRPKVNNFSLGIELEGLDDDAGGFTDEQYFCLTNLILCLMRRYPNISKQNIFAHSDIAIGRKPDPGPYFDWSRLLRNL